MGVGRAAIFGSRLFHVQSFTVKCPHCTVAFHDQPKVTYIGKDDDGHWAWVRRDCPACKRLILSLQFGSDVVFTPQGNFMGLNVLIETLARPKGINRSPIPTEVPKKFGDDYNEGCLVLPDSSKAAAALGRRCLQNLLREIAGVKPGNLADEIQQVIDSGKLPSDLSDSIDAIRNIGNFAAHPMKSQHSGEILDVEAGEAEWTLDVLEGLFDFYFVRPANLQKKKDALDQKLKDAGKPPMK
jgi:hypothetical protein